MKKRIIWLWKEHRKITIALIVVIILLLSIFGTQIYLYINFLLGNNVVVKLDVSPQLLLATKGETVPLKVKASVATNPFCSVACKVKVYDLADEGQERILLEENATLRPGLSFDEEVPVSVDKKGQGTLPLRVELECAGIKTFFCHTDGQPTTRNQLVMVQYNLSNEEKTWKEEVKQKLNPLQGELWMFLESFRNQKVVLAEVNDSLETEPFEEAMERGEIAAGQTLDKLQQFQELWMQEEYEQLNLRFGNFLFAQPKEILQAASSQVENSLQRYRQSLALMETTREKAAVLGNLTLLNASLAEAVQLELRDYNQTIIRFNSRTSLEEKELLANSAAEKINSLERTAMRQNDEDVLAMAVEANIIANIICQGKGSLDQEKGNLQPEECISMPTLIQLAKEVPANVSNACAAVHDLRLFALSLKPFLEQEAAVQDYPATADFNETIRVLAENAQQIERNQMLAEVMRLAKVPEEVPQKEILLSLLTFARPSKTASYPLYNLTPAVLLQLLEKIPSECKLANVKGEVLPITVKKISSTAEVFPTTESPFVEATKPSLLAAWEEPPAKCCLKGQCPACCTETSCRENASYYPVIFLHGHAFNKETSYEYSLDAFNGIQQKLEKDGFLSAGAVSLYTKKDLPFGEFGLFNVPMTIKASYYVDLFQTPENYVIVQTKSEGLDVYALRLKEILDTIKYQTERPKVIIVAHSMGGLVTRRYMQIFGSANIAKLITIGTPHQGIAGDVADYCELVGEQRECKDMNTDSVFMNKLKNAGLPSIPVTTIIGVGCDMDGEQGDGIVLEQNAELEGAKKHLIKGTCSTLSPLHTDLLDVSKSPEVYEIIREELGT